MKWYKHLSDAHTNPDMIRLRQEWGNEGYGWWWLLIELVAGQIHRGGLSFSLQTNTESPLTPTDLAPTFKIDAERLEQFLSYLATNQLIDSGAWLERKLIYVPKLKELSDEYIVKLLRENGRDKVGTKSEHKKKKKKEKKKKNSTPVVEIPQALLSKLGFTDAWTAWESHRREIGKPLKPTGIQRQLKFLVKQPDPVAVIEQAIRNGWQGLFALKNGQKSGHSRPVRDAIAVSRELMKAQELIQEMEKSGQKES